MIYDFLDTNEVTAQNGLPAEAINFNGVWLDQVVEGFRTLTVTGRESIEAEVKETDTPNRDGNYYDGRRYLPRTITVQYQLLAQDAESFRRAYDALLLYLSAEQVRVVFNDAVDRFYIGTKTVLSDPPAGANNVVGEIEIYCTDPFAYSVEEYEQTASNGEIKVLYDGTYKAYPTIEATCASALGYVGYMDEDDNIIQIGNPDEIGSADVSQTLLDQTFNSSVPSGWLTNDAPAVVGVTEHKKVGTWKIGTTLNGKALMPNSYGSGSAFHGPALTYVLPADSGGELGAAKCQLDIFQLYTTATVNDLGSVWYQLCTYTHPDATDRADKGVTEVATITFWKKSQGQNWSKCDLRIGGQVMKSIDGIDSGYWNAVTGYPVKVGSIPPKSRNAGRHTIKKFGNKITFTVAGKAYEYTVPALADTKVYEVTVWIGGYGNKTIGMNACHSLRFTKHSADDWSAVPNKFATGDVILADCGSGMLSVNGDVQYGLGAMGNDWEQFSLHRGLNTIRCFYSDWGASPTFKLRYRKAWL